MVEWICKACSWSTSGSVTRDRPCPTCGGIAFFADLRVRFAGRAQHEQDERVEKWYRDWKGKMAKQTRPGPHQMIMGGRTPVAVRSV